MATKLGVYNQVARLVGEPVLSALTDETELRRVLDEAYDDAVDFVLNSVPWKFAVKEVSVAEDTSGTPPSMAGYDKVYVIPSDAIRVVGAFDVIASGRAGDRPFDCRISSGYLYNNIPDSLGNIRVHYISTDGRTEAGWSPGYFHSLCAYLAFEANQRITSLNGRSDDLYGLYQRQLAMAAEREAISENPWFPRQLDGSFLQSVRYMLSQGAWRFALKTANLSTPSGALVGWQYNYAFPDDFVKTHAVYAREGSTRRTPVEVREHSGGVAANIDAVTLEYVSNESLHNPRLWPEQFLRAVGAHLGINQGDLPAIVRDDEGNASEQTTIWPDYLQRALGECAVPPDRWWPFQQSGAFTRAIRTVGAMAFWRFALDARNVAAVTPATPIVPSYAQSHAIPADHVRTQGIHAVTNGVERPVDARETSDGWASNESSIVVQFTLDSLLIDSTVWPEEYVELVYAYLVGVEEWQERLDRATLRLAVGEDRWLPFQLNGQFAYAVDSILQMAFWRFAMKSVTVAADTPAAVNHIGHAQSHTIPEDHVRTQAIYKTTGAVENPVDVREHSDKWTSNESSIHVTYLSSDLGRDTALWPGQFLELVYAYLTNAENWPDLFMKARRDLSIEESPWLRFQLDGSFEAGVRSLIYEHGWHFATKTIALTSPSEGGIGAWQYTYSQPADLSVTVRLFHVDDDQEDRDIAYREELGNYYADYGSAVYVEYVDEDVMGDPAMWPEYFDRALLAYLSYQEALGRSDTPGAVLEARRRAWEDTFKNSRQRDVIQERPRTYRYPGTFVSARGGYLTREQR